MLARMKRGFKFLARYGYALSMCGYLFSIGFLSSRNRSLLWAICEHFGYGSRKVEPVVPKCSLSDLFLDGAPLRVRCPETVHGNVSLLELLVLANLVNRHSPQVLLEIGTFDGRTTLNLAANSVDEASVYTLDLPANSVGTTKFPLLAEEMSSAGRDRSDFRFRGSGYEHKIIPLVGDSASFDFSFLKDKVDFVFVDGSHRYEYVVSDSKKALDVLGANGGIVVWHDYGTWDDVTRALNELYIGQPELKNLRHVEGTTLAYAVLNKSSATVAGDAGAVARRMERESCA
jgi:predicted O-methyltransferase YrrM